ncbi:MAG: hypothetical protein ICV68_06530, partial [Pyrinomonadaceae bacterium]|nr:hypothetical protein [Pyrinomonadaceae bacterium]
MSAVRKVQVEQAVAFEADERNDINGLTWIIASAIILLVGTLLRVYDLN